MNVILWLVAGGLIGWVVNKFTQPDTPRAVVFNLWIGAVGAALGGWFLSLLASFLGAAILLLATAKLFHRGLTRF